MEKKYNVDSFNLDHTKVTAPFVRLAAKKVGEKGDIVTKFDIRFASQTKSLCLQVQFILLSILWQNISATKWKV